MPLVGVTLDSEDTLLRRAAVEAGIPGASVNELIRYAALRLVMGATEARDTVFGRMDEMQSTKGRAFGNIPEHEQNLLKERFPGKKMSEVVRAGLGLLAGDSPLELWEMAGMKPGPKPGSKSHAS